MALLEAQDLVKVYSNGKRAVQGVSFSVEKGEIVGLLGPTGAGKSTSFRMACGLTAPTDGKIFLNGKNVSSWPMYQRCRIGMGYLPQDHSYFVKLTVEENILAILDFFPISHKERMQKIDKLLTQFGLQNRRKQIAHTMSGGEKRRLEIARCLASDPQIILLDEPFTGIDPITINDIQDIISELRDSGISILLTDHRERETLTITDRNYVIVEGRVLVSGDAKTVLSNEEAQTKYFGKRFDASSILEEKNNYRADKNASSTAAA